MATSTIKNAVEYQWKLVTRTVSHPAGTNYWSIQIPFPAKAGYTRQMTNLQSSNANVVVVTGYADSNGTYFWRTNNLSSSAQQVTLSALLVYLKDDHQWT